MEPIFVWWIGEREADPAMIDHVRRELSRAFDRPVVRHQAAARPAEAYDPRRRQWASGKILHWLLEHGPRDGPVLAVTDRDLFIPILTYVFGEAQLGGRAAVVSTARLSEDAAPPGRAVLEERLVKEAVHELGHVLGLLHCGSPGCVMGRSAGVRDVDAKGHALCVACRGLLAEPPGRRRHVQ